MLAIARILKSYGTDGGLLVSSDVDLESLEKGEPVYIVYDGLEVPFFISACTPKGSRYSLHLPAICSLEDADEVVGRDILADVSEDADGPDFIGWTVYDAASAGEPRLLGVVTDDAPIPGNYCLFVGDVMIPLHEDFIVSTDPERRELVLNLPAGLY